MRIDEAIKTIKKVIELNKVMIEEDPKSDFSIFMKRQNDAFETLLEYAKRNLN